MSLYDFLCMPSLDKVTMREEPHGLDTSILDRVADHTTSPAPTGTAIPYVTLEKIVVTRPDRKVVTKADNAAKRKASTGPKISTNATNKTRSSKKGSGAGSSGQAAEDEVEKDDDGTLNDDKEVKPHVELFGDVRRTTRASSRVSHASRDDGNGSDGNVDPYYEARVSNTAGDVLEKDLLPLVPGPYYIPYPYDEGSGNDSPPYTKDDWEEIHGVNLGLLKKELYKDPKVCRNALDRFPTPTDTHRLRELFSNVDRLMKRCSQETHIIKKQNADIRQQSESVVHANEEVSRLKPQPRVLESKCQIADKKLSSWDKKHRKYRNEKDALAIEKAKIEED
ncbi:hypothetical protein Tco_0045064, partial [Tanacetum coccineum]